MSCCAGVSLLPGLPTTTLQLSVSCKALYKKDVFSKSDPFVVLYLKSKDQWIEQGRTEEIKNNSDPSFKTKFVVNYSFEEQQWVKFEVYDLDKLTKEDLIGSTECLLSQIVTAPGKTFIAPILPEKDKKKLFKGIAPKPSKAGPEIQVVAKEADPQKETIEIQFGATNLDKKDIIGKSDPYFTLSKQLDNGEFVTIYKSEVIKNNLDPIWKKLVITKNDLCDCDFNRNIKMEVFDFDDVGIHDVIGSFNFTVAKLQNAIKTFDVINPAKVNKKNYKDSGKIYLRHFKINTQNTTFFDFIGGGTQMEFAVGVDFTVSNGNVTNPSSLHYRAPCGGDNAYTFAIKAVGEVIEHYDIDRKFSAFGFGAQVPPCSQLSHNFHLNMKTDNPYCYGTQGILTAYEKARNAVTLSGPTCFAPVINHVARLAAVHQNNASRYIVLLILTDGAITDFDETRAAIVAASNLPMSIIIVGVGNEDFHAMKYFDSDDGPLEDAQGNKAARDIVQFVEMKKFLGPNGTYYCDLLTKELLAEVPHQMVGFMNSRRFKPLHC